MKTVRAKNFQIRYNFKTRRGICELSGKVIVGKVISRFYGIKQNSFIYEYSSNIPDYIDKEINLLYKKLCVDKKK